MPALAADREASTGTDSPQSVEDGCQVLYAEDDPRLFEFVTTRREVDFDVYQGKRVRAIRYITLPIFNEQDEHEDNWLYRTANMLHILTKESPLHQQLLIEAGEPVSRERIRESERILRDANYLFDAMILPATVCADSIDLLVVVRDVWTLQLTGSFSRTGGDNSSSIGLSEGNLLGYGHAVYVSYEADADRSGVAVGYASEHLLDGHTRLNLEHVENNDGNENTVVFERPFYSVDTPWAAGSSYVTKNLREKITTADVTSNEYGHHTETSEVYVGMLTSLQDNVAHRWRTGITTDRDLYDDQDVSYNAPLPRDRTIAYPWLEFESEEYDYWTTTNLYQLFRNEDINLGTLFSIRVGATSEGLGTTEEGWITRMKWQKTSSFGSHHVMQSQAYANLFQNSETEKFEHTLMGYAASYEHFIDDLNRWHVQLQYDVGRNLDPEETLTAGGSVLRGFKNGTQRGDRFALFNVEHRHFFDVHPFHLFRLGSAVFFEAGQAWDSHDRFEQSDQVLYDVGVGLRINSSKARSNHIFHINLAFPLNERDSNDKYQISFYTSEAF